MQVIRLRTSCCRAPYSSKIQTTNKWPKGSVWPDPSMAVMCGKRQTVWMANYHMSWIWLAQWFNCCWVILRAPLFHCSTQKPPIEKALDMVMLLESPALFSLDVLSDFSLPSSLFHPIPPSRSVIQAEQVNNLDVCSCLQTLSRH